MDCLGQSEVDIDSEKINKIIQDGIYVRQLNMNTIGKHSMKWVTNTIRNIPSILEYKNIKQCFVVKFKNGCDCFSWSITRKKYPFIKRVF